VVSHRQGEYKKEVTDQECTDLRLGPWKPRALASWVSQSQESTDVDQQKQSAHLQVEGGREVSEVEEVQLFSHTLGTMATPGNQGARR
jgi:hypothetical protein